MIAITARGERDHSEAFAIVVETPGGPMSVSGSEDARGRIAHVGSVRLRAGTVRSGSRLTVFLDGHEYSSTASIRATRRAPTAAAAGKLIAPMPRSVVRVAAEEGQKVREADPFVVIEAMKMEHTVAAPRDGTVAGVRYAAGTSSSRGAELLTSEE